MEALATQQNDYGKAIVQQFANFKKDSANRKTEEYLTKRLSTLESHWTVFLKNHTALLAYKDEHSEHLYFANNYFEEIQAIFTKYRALIIECQTKLQSSGSPITGQAHEIKTNNNTPKATEISSIQVQHESSYNSELSPILRKQQALIKMVEKVIDDINLNSTKEHSIEYYEFKINLLKKYGDDLARNDQDIWSRTDDETPQAYDANIYYHLDLKLKKKYDNSSAAKAVKTTTTGNYIYFTSSRVELNSSEVTKN